MMRFNTPRVESATEACFSSRSTSSLPSGDGTHSGKSSRSCDPSARSVKEVPHFLEKRCKSYNSINSAKTSETCSDIVPPLDLQSEENYPNGGYTYSCRKHCETTKLDRNPDLAYDTWLSAKRKILSDQAARRREIEEKKRHEFEERKRISKEIYEKWLENKAKRQETQFNNLNNKASQQNLKSQNIISVKDMRCHLSETEVKAHLDEWQRTKRLQQERRRMIKQQEEQMRRELEEERRRCAVEAWEKWLAEAAKKPKPVPLNRGLSTLRGTVSDIFVNPNEWKSVLPNVSDDKAMGDGRNVK
ncbi:trichohyalin-like [Stomoxys calcitrans]|uniref:trichohyalin-like n=1 Tax=Stomoxys calcitrans TaxID=35570 RepID=UPI0027E36E4C|nr:trichohyalin-like [Stomoxys calcitrans]